MKPLLPDAAGDPATAPEPRSIHDAAADRHSAPHPGRAACILTGARAAERDRAWVEGGVTAPAGFRAAGVACGLKKGGELDLALLVSDSPATAAALFTTNLVKAAPVLLDMEVLASGHPVSLVVANSRVANACTGEAGLLAAREMAEAARTATGAPGAAFVLSTGVIGRRLPMPEVRAGIRAAAGRLDRTGGADAARAILTTDTHAKQAAARVDLPDGPGFTIGGMAKGAGMIHPNMATLLAVLTTDAAVERHALQAALAWAADRSFHAISVDGDTSTNDTLLLLANGLAGAERSTNGRPSGVAGGTALPGSLLPLALGTAGWVAFRDALTRVCVRLARMIAADGEGARKLIQIDVSGAESDRAALAIGRVIATSPLVKTALGAADPNWGRIAAAAGRSGEAVDPAVLGIAFASAAGHVQVMERGEPLEFSEEAATGILEPHEIRVSVVVGGGPGRAAVWTCDLSEGYVRTNSAYRT